MKYLFVFFISVVCLAASAQRDTELQIRVGMGVAAYATDTKIDYKINTPFGPIPQSYEDSGGAVTVHIPIELRYEVSKRFNIGLDMKFGSYLYEDNQNNASKSNAFRSFGLGTELVVLSKENTRLYVGLCLNSTLLEMSEDVVYNNQIEKTIMTWRAPGVKLNLGFMQYFGSSPLGINFNMGLDAHNFKLKEWKYPTPSSWVTLGSSNGTLTANGFDLALGLVYRFRK